MMENLIKLVEWALAVLIAVQAVRVALVRTQRLLGM